MSYDPHCYDLAKLFLDEVGIVEERQRQELAQRLQETIEGYIAGELYDDDDTLSENE